MQSAFDLKRASSPISAPGVYGYGYPEATANPVDHVKPYTDGLPHLYPSQPIPYHLTYMPPMAALRSSTTSPLQTPMHAISPLAHETPPSPPPALHIHQGLRYTCEDIPYYGVDQMLRRFPAPKPSGKRPWGSHTKSQPVQVGRSRTPPLNRAFQHVQSRYRSPHNAAHPTTRNHADVARRPRSHSTDMRYIQVINQPIHGHIERSLSNPIQRRSAGNGKINACQVIPQAVMPENGVPFSALPLPSSPIHLERYSPSRSPYASPKRSSAFDHLESSRTDNSEPLESFRAHCPMARAFAQLPMGLRPALSTLLNERVPSPPPIPLPDLILEAPPRLSTSPIAGLGKHSPLRPISASPLPQAQLSAAVNTKVGTVSKAPILGMARAPADNDYPYKAVRRADSASYSDAKVFVPNAPRRSVLQRRLPEHEEKALLTSFSEWKYMKWSERIQTCTGEMVTDPPPGTVMHWTQLTPWGVSTACKGASALFPPDEELNSKVAVWKGTVLHVECDAVVNSAEESCGFAHVHGVDAAIRECAGRALQYECALYNGCREGHARITKGYRLPSRFIIHAVPPKSDVEKLKSCYFSVLELAVRHQCRTVTFCCVGKNALGVEKAARAGIEAVRLYLGRGNARSNFDLIVFACFSAIELRTYTDLMHFYFPIPRSTSSSGVHQTTSIPLPSQRSARGSAKYTHSVCLPLPQQQLQHSHHNQHQHQHQHPNQTKASRVTVPPTIGRAPTPTLQPQPPTAFSDSQTILSPSLPTDLLNGPMLAPLAMPFLFPPPPPPELEPIDRSRSASPLEGLAFETTAAASTTVLSQGVSPPSRSSSTNVLELQIPYTGSSPELAASPDSGRMSCSPTTKQSFEGVSIPQIFPPPPIDMAISLTAPPLPMCHIISAPVIPPIPFHQLPINASYSPPTSPTSDTSSLQVLPPSSNRDITVRHFDSPVSGGYARFTSTKGDEFDHEYNGTETFNYEHTSSQSLAKSYAECHSSPLRCPGVNEHPNTVVSPVSQGSPTLYTIESSHQECSIQMPRSAIECPPPLPISISALEESWHEAAESVVSAESSTVMNEDTARTMISFNEEMFTSPSVGMSASF